MLWDFKNLGRSNEIYKLANGESCCKIIYFKGFGHFVQNHFVIGHFALVTSRSQLRDRSLRDKTLRNEEKEKRSGMAQHPS